MRSRGLFDFAFVRTVKHACATAAHGSRVGSMGKSFRATFEGGRPAWRRPAYLEETSGAEGQPTAPSEALCAEKLRRLHQELIGELRDALLDGNKNLLNRLIIKVRETEDTVAAQALQKLGDRYEYDVLTRLLEASPS